MQVYKKTIFSKKYTTKIWVLTTLLLLPISVKTFASSGITFRLNNNEINFEQHNSPYIEEGTTYLPVRFLSETLGKEVTWNTETQDIIIKTGTITTKLRVGREVAIVDGKYIPLEKGPVTKDNTTYIPLRAVSEALNINVDFDVNTKTISINGDVYKKQEKPKAQYLPEEVIYQDIEAFGRTFRGPYRSNDRSVVIVKKEFYPELQTTVGTIKKMHYKDGKITLLEEPRIKKLGLGSRMYFVTDKGIDRAREPKSRKLNTGEILSTYSVVSSTDFAIDPNYQTLSVEKGHIKYVIIEHKKDDVLIAIPISELM